MRIRRGLRIGLVIVGGTLVATVLLFVGGIAFFFGLPTRDVNKAVARFKPGMTVEQAVAVIPTDFALASIEVLMRTGPCKEPSGKISAPEEFPQLFPEMKDDDVEGKQIAWNASQIPLRLDRFELLDEHLRARKDWPLLIQAWTVYLQNTEHPEATAYYRRGTAYLAQNDFSRGYSDEREACRSGSKESCADLKKLRPEKVDAIETEVRRTNESAPSCEPEIPWYSLSGPVVDDKFNVRVHTPGRQAEPQSTEMTRAELANSLNRNFEGREWIAKFTFLPTGPLHLTFHFVVGRDGKLTSISPLQSWD